jgi:GDP-L-fucose synthase
MSLAFDRVLVTGGCGFVGRHIVKRMADLGARCVVVDNLSAGKPSGSWPEHLRVQRQGALDEHHVDIRDYMISHEPDFDVIFHCAAVVGGRMMIDGDPLKVATDLAIDADFFNWVVRGRQPRQVVYFSSSAAYPVSLQESGTSVALEEGAIDLDSSIGSPDMTYGWAKLTGEFLARFAAERYGLKVACYRPFSGYGEDQDFSYPFPSIIRRVLLREDPLVIWGSGNQLRDFIYIEDVVDAVLATMQVMPSGDVLNLGSGVGTSFRELAALACKTFGHEARIINDPSKPEGVYARVADVQKLGRYYTPTTSLQRGVEIVYESLARLNAAGDHRR